MRRRVACDACEAAAWIGPAPEGGVDAWCEACQSGVHLAAGAAATCAQCGAAMAVAVPRFPGLWGALQNLDAVLKAWDGNWAPLAALLPERPRFRTDLTPPSPRPGDAPELLAVLDAAARGHYAAVIASPLLEDPRAHAARAIAYERRGDPLLAEAAWTGALVHGEWEQASLARGVLRARAARWDAAGEDLMRAGAGDDARWNRAALLVHRAMAGTPGFPARRVFEQAGAEAGPASAYWSDATVGRLAWTLLTERTLARREAGELLEGDLSTLREAEDLFEHGTFWDRAMMLVTYARLGLGGDATRVAMPLARELASALLLEPALKGQPLAAFTASLVLCYDAIASRLPRPAHRALYLWMRDERLRHYRLPCAACGKGGVGVVAFEGEEVEEAGGAL